jgi:hypothetical protein
VIAQKQKRSRLGEDLLDIHLVAVEIGIIGLGAVKKCQVRQQLVTNANVHRRIQAES